eukprot:TRINITY_DN11838_c0_g1_i1.p1 TRINITY_DN11838_c0_g1~~TRINITY_DN11838_c0_g1_i1.p1  ORF type:complete len:103 (-),score=9.71 TRINITY_DN11838_c0_g1_i1:498-806(-)
MINESMVHILDVEMAKSLSLVSRSISKNVRHFMEENFYLIVYNKKRFAFYQPKNIKNVSSVPSINLTRNFHDLFRDSFDLSMFTNITFLELRCNFNDSIENK